jgi:glycogen synthase
MRNHALPQELQAPIWQDANSALRIGYLLQNGAPELSTLSGAQLHTVAVIKGLQKLGHHVRTVAIQRNKLGWSDDLQGWHAPQYGPTQKRGFRLFESAIRRVQSELHLAFVGLFDSLRYADACTHLLQGCDLLYERHGYMGYGGMIAARRLGIPIVIELNGNIIKEIDTMGVQMSPRQREVGRWLTYRTFLAADHVVIVSAALKEILVSAFDLPEARISVVLNGVDVDVFARPVDQAQVRAAHNLTNAPTIAFVGTFQPWHGVDLLVASFQLVQAAYPTAQLLIIGDGVGREAVAKQITALGLEHNIRLLGQLAQVKVAELLHIADLAVAPYPFQHNEIVGTPLKIMEYMAAGKAIVASTAPLHEIVKQGVTGVRVMPANAQALAGAIIQLLGDDGLRATLGENARCQAQQYSWQHVVERLCTIFSAQLANKANLAPARRVHLPSIQS